MIHDIKEEEVGDSEEYGVCDFDDRISTSVDDHLMTLRSVAGDVDEHRYVNNCYANISTCSSEPLSLVVQRPLEMDSADRTLSQSDLERSHSEN